MFGISRRHAASVVIAFALIAAACGSSSMSSSSPSTTAAGGATATTVAPMTGSLNVFAAASLTEAFNDMKTALAKSDPNLEITYNFAGSQALVTQIQEGAPADDFASADEKNMQKLVDDNSVDTPQIFARNKLEIAVASGNPKGITGLADLEKSGVTLVLADKTVPAGNYALQAFEKAGLPAPKPASTELDVKSTIQKLTTGEADAVIVYATDVTAAGDKVEGVELPDDQNVIASYPIAVVKATKNMSAAEGFVNYVLSDQGQAILKARGFLPPS
jgi:molybdate transport system substrate-binding protein